MPFRFGGQVVPLRVLIPSVNSLGSKALLSMNGIAPFRNFFGLGL